MRNRDLMVCMRSPDGVSPCWRSCILFRFVFFTRRSLVWSCSYTLENIPRSTKTTAQYFCRKVIHFAKYSRTRCGKIAQGGEECRLCYWFHVALQSPYGCLLGLRANIWLHVVCYLRVLCLGRTALVCERVWQPVYILCEKQVYTPSYVERDFKEKLKTVKIFVEKQKSVLNLELYVKLVSCRYEHEGATKVANF